MKASEMLESFISNAHYVEELVRPEYLSRLEQLRTAISSLERENAELKNELRSVYDQNYELDCQRSKLQYEARVAKRVAKEVSND